MVTAAQPHIVTGAFGFSGRFIAKRLLSAGLSVRTLTNKQPCREAYAPQIEHYPLRFDDPDRLTASLKGAQVLYNTYWVRFNHRHFNFDQAVSNSLLLFQCARRAGIRRVVHVSITNPDADSHLPYFKGKAVVEEALVASGLDYTILRPAVLFGPEDILINNIAWMLRTMPVFGLFGKGRYGIQPLFVDDLAAIAADAAHSRENKVLNTVGPETFTYRQLVETIRTALKLRTPILPLPPTFGLLVARLAGMVLGDIVVTADEIKGLMEGRLLVDSPPIGKTHLSRWVQAHAARVGRQYAHELRRR